MDSLPLDIIIFGIKPYLPLNIIYNTNKKNFTRYKTENYTSLDGSVSKEYIIFILKNDYDYIFNILYNAKFIMWNIACKMKENGNTFYCLVDLLEYNCNNLKSRKCKNIIRGKKINKGIKEIRRIRIIHNNEPIKFD